MSLKKTGKGTKKFTKAEKLAIIKEAAKHGVKVTLEKYDLYPATFYYWKKKFTALGDEGLDHGITKERLARIKELEKENATLKKLLAEEKLEGELKMELIKKKYPRLKKLR